MNFFHTNETPNLNNKFFNEKKNLLKYLPKILIISGGSRNGNHLVWSLLDGNKDLPYLPGEDKFLSGVFWQNFRNFKKFKKNFLKNKHVLMRMLSGVTYDKWEKIFNKKVNKKKWAGAYESLSAPLMEFPDSIQKINYKKYKNFLKKNLNIKFNFYELFKVYLNAYSLLSPQKKNSKYKYIYAESGLRRELLYLLNSRTPLKCIVPVRKFESYFFSKIKSKFGNVNLTKKNIKEAWEQWYHKTNDYLFLKKKFPNKIILVLYEDLASIQKREVTIKKILKKINIKFNKINLKPTHFKQAVIPNSSFGKKRLQKKKLLFPKKKLPKDYFEIYKHVQKYSY